ncbi:MAG: hypothetical protein MZV63_06075 [Marinilabiliales bacterium]|nr:hypothetical protein [Marinilabiliales bacterium]
MLVTTLTKRMAEDLTEYYQRARRARALPALGHRHARAGRDPARPAARASSTCWSASTCCARGSTCPRSRWWRSSTPTRRASSRSARSLIQTIGRAARNVRGKVILYADTVTDSMRRAIDETERRRTAAGRVQRARTASRRDDQEGDPRHDARQAPNRDYLDLALAPVEPSEDGGGRGRVRLARRADRGAADRDVPRGREARVRAGGGAARPGRGAHRNRGAARRFPAREAQGRRPRGRRR